ncbi:hypothetical protein J5N97_007471 [Dioscorea zingiberensis]|uniref:Uncharacterized protein n=1 Tax=Dioscorea zingiberensis TaxID=325984 RepID=A0A9D5HTL1_9LILI|nr:hypothetical protein J5N97_007471 [Dioscorea zingiberensis]
MCIISSSSPSLNSHLQTLKAKKPAMLIRIMNLMFLFIVFSSAFVGDCLTSDVHDGETPPGSDEKCTCSPCGSPCNDPSSPPPSPPSPPPPSPPLPSYNPPSPYCPPPPYYASPTPPDYYKSTPPPPYYYGQTPPSPNYVWNWKPPGSLYPIDPNYNLSSNRRSLSLMLQAFLGCVLLALLKF